MRFYLPLALAIDAQVFLIVHAAYQVYQFFVHTRSVDRLGPARVAVRDTEPPPASTTAPSAATSIATTAASSSCFDRLFGTFQRRGPRAALTASPGGYAMTSPLFAKHVHVPAPARPRARPLSFREARAALVRSAGKRRRISCRPPPIHRASSIARGVRGTWLPPRGSGRRAPSRSPSARCRRRSAWWSPSSASACVEGRECAPSTAAG